MKSTAVEFITVLAVGSNFIALTKAHEFLRTSSNGLSERVSRDAVRRSLELEIEQIIRDGNSSKHYAALEAALKPIYRALPKHDDGYVDHTAASYALHRLFVARHGWAVKGLGPTSGKYDTSSPHGILKDEVPGYIEDMFDERLGGKGFKLHDLAVLAATIEHLIHDEAIGRLQQAFDVHGDKGAIPFSAANDVLDTYMAAFVLSKDLSNMTTKAAKGIRFSMPHVFNYWKETQELVHGIKNSTLPESSHSAGTLDFASLAKVGEAVSDKFGSFFHQSVCTPLKNRLMQLEYKKSGRIKLSDFYKPALDGFWQFQESPAYLREVGALEEKPGRESKVLIANYMAAPSNCIASTGFYSVCCKNECERLLGQVEDMVGAPQALVPMLAVLVATLPSPTKRYGRGALPPHLRQRLDEIGKHHNGMVPLHSRLFAQFMHHVYPHECPYPHISGTTSAKLPEDWLTDSGLTATEDEMLLHSNWSGDVTEEEDHDIMTWSTEEELVVVRPAAMDASGENQQWRPSSATTPLLSFLRSTWMWLCAASFAYGLCQTARSMRSKSKADADKMFV